MFHVKPHFLKRLLIKFSITIFLAIISQGIVAQKEKDFKVGIGSDLALGGNYNNHAASIKISYNILDRIRIVPAYAIYLNEGKKKMNTISFDVNYLIPNFSKKIFPKSIEEIFFIYPVAGFFILNNSNSTRICIDCISEHNLNSANYESNFGFDFGIGSEYKLPSSSKFLKRSSLFFEVKYIAIERFNRILFTSGLLYKL